MDFNPNNGAACQVQPSMLLETGGDIEIVLTSSSSNGNASSNFTPRIVYTRDPGFSQITNTYKVGDTLYGYIDMNGGNIDDVYGCTEGPTRGNCSA